MASTSSIGAQSSANAAQAQQFYSDFTSKLQGIKENIKCAQNVQELQQISTEMSVLRVNLTDKTEILPTYDRQTHEVGLRETNEYINARRSELAPRRGFAFQRKSKVPSAAYSRLDANEDNVSSSSSDAITTTEALPGTSFADTPSFSLSSKSSEKLTRSSMDLTKHSTDLHLLQLDHCLVDLRPASSSDCQRYLAVQIRDLKRCVVLLGDVQGSAMIHNCESCVFVLACRQFRMHTSKCVSVLISTTSAATIEHCRNVQFAPAPKKLIGIVRESSQDTPEKGEYPTVQDFDHIDESEPSQNWKKMDRRTLSAIEHSLLVCDDNGKVDEVLSVGLTTR